MDKISPEKKFQDIKKIDEVEEPINTLFSSMVLSEGEIQIAESKISKY